MHRPYINNNDRGQKSTKYVETKHHIFNKYNGGTNSKDNIIKLFDPVHQAYHRVFGIELIKGSLIQILKINDSALSDEFKSDIDKLLYEDDLEYYYKNGVYCKR